MTSQWGRKETIIWPPHQPVYTYLALVLALFSSCLFIFQRYYYQSPLEKAYTTDYARAEVGASLNQSGIYRLLYVEGPRNPQRLALPLDFVPGQTRQPDGAIAPRALSPLAVAAGYTGFHRGPATSYKDGSLARWYRTAVFADKSLTQVYAVSFLETLPVLVLALYLSVPYDLKRFRQMKYGRVLRGPRMMEPAEFRKLHKGDGIGLQTTEMHGLMRIPAQKESQHFQLMGDTGAGKTQIIMQMLRQIRARGESAIVYDPKGEFMKRFFDKDRGDIVLNPLDERCPSWGPANELESNAEADTISESLYQPGPESAGKDEFFHKTPAQIFAHLLKQGPTTQQLTEWMANRRELEKRCAGTELLFYIDRNAGPQSAGVLSSLALVANNFRLLPAKAENRPEWSARSWAKDRKGWIFISSRRTHRAALRPLHSLWIDLLVMRLQDPPAPGQKKVWFVIDELASLQRLPQLHTAITENRASMNPLVLGFQGGAQLEMLYGQLAKTILSQASTKGYMRTTEPDAAKWISQAIGEIEIERVKETRFDGSRSGKNFTIDRQIEPLVLPSEISGLSDRHAYIKLGNDVVRFSFDYMDLPVRAEDFIPRSWPGGDLSFDPDTLEPKTRITSQSTAASSAAAKPEPPLPADEDDEAPAPVKKQLKKTAAKSSRPRRPKFPPKPKPPATPDSPVEVSEGEAAEEAARETERQEKFEQETEVAVEDHHAMMAETVIQEGLVLSGHDF